LNCLAADDCEALVTGCDGNGVVKSIFPDRIHDLDTWYERDKAVGTNCGWEFFFRFFLHTDSSFAV
jgi:hypothetical protein